MIVCFFENLFHKISAKLQKLFRNLAECYSYKYIRCFYENASLSDKTHLYLFQHSRNSLLHKCHKACLNIAFYNFCLFKS